MIPEPGTRWMRKGDELVRESVEILDASPMVTSPQWVFVSVRNLETRLPGSHVWHRDRNWAEEWDRL